MEQLQIHPIISTCCYFESPRTERAAFMIAAAKIGSNHPKITFFKKKYQNMSINS